MDWEEWVLKPTIGKVLWALLALGYGVVLAALKKKGSTWFVPALWGLLGAAVALSCLFAVAGILGLASPSKPPLEPPPPKQQSPSITPDNVETHIKGWLDHFALSVKVLQEEDYSGAVFALEVTSVGGVPVWVARPKAFPNYIVLQAPLALSSENQDLLSKLTPGEQAGVRNELYREMLTARVRYNLTRPFNDVSVSRRIPITDSLSEHTFTECFDEVTIDALLMNYTVERCLEDLKSGRE